jgi:eukaryotic-like serine/threonine-protein kinase
MALAPGTRLGPYEIIAPLGAGGMGEVYQAHDSRLSREVALKILPDQLGADTERRARFEREARAAAQIHHPNILSVLDVGTEDSTPYIVTELLEGDTLRERLRSGPIPTRKAVEYGAKIARGLGAAHEKGITHRDIKPENIFLCTDGQVKILDFGLARATAPEAAESDSTLSLRTGTGIVLGTASYLSPEQARGQSIDGRSDIFSLGTVLYEMLAGQRPFLGDSFADLLTSILREDPPPLPASAKVSPALERIIRRCLEKSPAERFQSARDLAFQLESLDSSLTSDSQLKGLPEIPEAPEPPKRSSLLPWLLAACFALSTLCTFWWYRFHVATSAVPDHVEFERLTDFVGMEETPAFSPDGKSIAFVSDTSGMRQIYIRLLAGGPPLQLTHDAADHLNPRWSSDSASIYYITRAPDSARQVTAWQISALGGAPRRLVDTLGEVDPSHDGKSLAFFRLNADRIELVRTNLNGEHVQVVASFPKQYGCHQPRWSPDDASIAFISTPNRWNDNIFYVPSSGGTPKQITRDALYLAGYSWLPDGSGLVYSSPRLSTMLYLPPQHLWKISLDGSSLHQLTFGNLSDESPDVDIHGHIALARTRLDFDIWKFPIDGSPADNVKRSVRVTNQTGAVQTPSLSPDGTQLAYLSDTGGHANIWIIDLHTLQTRQVTFEKDPETVVGVPLWSHDGTTIAYVSFPFKSGTAGIQYWITHPDGSGNRQFSSGGTGFSWAWDSKSAYVSKTAADPNEPVLQVLKLPFPSGNPVLIRSDSAVAPVPSPDGTTLFYERTLESVNGLWDYEIRAAKPENSPDSKFLARISYSRVPMWQALHPSISPDARWLALTLNDRFGTNLWLLSTADGQMHAVTDFGDRRTFIVRHVTWAPDNKSIYAAIGDGDSDIFLLSGLLN